MSEPIELIKQANLAAISLNRPDAYNAMNLEMLTQLARNLTELATDDSVRGIVITGKGKAFCSGGDLKWTVAFSKKTASSMRILAAQLHLVIVEIRRMSKPVVAAINGAAAGAGFSLALACDFRIMEKSAMLKQAYTSNGLSFDGGATFILPRIVGLARALEIAAFDPPISAEQAAAWELVTKVVEDGKSLEEAMKVLSKLARRSLHAFGISKKLLNDSFSNSLESHLEMEREGISDCASHPDGQEGIHAFLEKRKPVFDTVHP
jgi:2-(1,2-epoxy-1,2-dihydrophenyl)acetyl-CoA isomerase